jgi:hypothetical protein
MMISPGENTDESKSTVDCCSPDAALSIAVLSPHIRNLFCISSRYAGFDHGVGRLISTTPQQRSDLIAVRVEISKLSHHPESSRWLGARLAQEGAVETIIQDKQRSKEERHQRWMCVKRAALVARDGKLHAQGGSQR